MAPEVFFSVCYGNSNPAQAIKDLHTFTPATLDGYSRHRVLGADYPAIIADSGGSVIGIFATGLTDANMVKLDFFEGSEYRRAKVDITLATAGSDQTAGDLVRSASTYIYLNPDALEDGEWDFEHFRREKLRFWSRAGLTFGEGDFLLYYTLCYKNS